MTGILYKKWENMRNQIAKVFALIVANIRVRFTLDTPVTYEEQFAEAFCGVAKATRAEFTGYKITPCGLAGQKELDCFCKTGLSVAIRSCHKGERTGEVELLCRCAKGTKHFNR